MRDRTRIQIIFGFAVAFVFASVYAQSATVDFTQSYTLKTVPLGFGGAYRALADSNAAILVNPAGMALRKGVVVAGGEFLSAGSMDGMVLSASVIDFKATEMIALALEYDRSTFNAGNDVTVNQFTLGAAVPIGQILYVGANAKGYISTVDSPFQTGPDGVDMSLGLLVKPIPMVSLGLTIDNLFLGNQREEFPFLVGFGLGLTLEESARLAVDLVRNFQSASSAAINAYFGAELKAAEGIFLRGGFGLDRILDNNFYSLGLVAAGPNISLNFTFSQRLNPQSETYAAGIEFAF
jgi:hypothetical protein